MTGICRTIGKISILFFYVVIDALNKLDGIFDKHIAVLLGKAYNTQKNKIFYI